MTDGEFESFVRRYRPDLMRGARGIVHDRDDAEDLCQEILLAAWLHRAAIRRPLAYCQVALRHRGWNLLLNRSRLPLFVEEHPQSVPATESAEQIVMGCAEFFRVQEMVRRCRLTGKQQRRMTLHYLDGYTHQEIAVKDGVHPTAITDSIRSALIALRRAGQGGPADG